MTRMAWKSQALNIYNNKHLNKNEKRLSHFEPIAVTLTQLDIFVNIFFPMIEFLYYKRVFKIVLRERALHIHNNKHLNDMRNIYHALDIQRQP